MSAIQRLTAALLIASIPLSALASEETCDTVLWSKESPNKALVIRHMEHDNTAFLTCTGHLDEIQKKHVMDSCQPIEPERKYYAKDELKADWLYLIKRSAKDEFGPVLVDTVVGFFVAEFAVSFLGQRVLARGVASMGEHLAAIGPDAAEAVASTGKVLGVGSNLFEGSRLVANDAFLRFFPAYIGAGMGFAWAGINGIKDGGLDRSMKRASALSPLGYRHDSCGPRELHQEFTGTQLRTPSIEEFEESLRTALKMSQERPDSWAITNRKNKELAKSDAEKTADQSAPVIGPTAEAAVAK